MARKRAKEGGEREKSLVHRLGPLRGLMNAGVAAGDSRCRQTGRRRWSRSLSLFCALFHYRLQFPGIFFLSFLLRKKGERKRTKERESEKQKEKRENDDFNDVLRFTGSASKRKTTVGREGGRRLREKKLNDLSLPSAHTDTLARAHICTQSCQQRSEEATAQKTDSCNSPDSDILRSLTNDHA